MRDTEKQKLNRICLITAMVLTLASFLIIRAKYSFVPEANDDAVIRSILSGNYTGTPDAHAIYPEYPLALMISGLYHIFPKADCYSTVMVGFFFLALFEILRSGGLLGMHIFPGKNAADTGVSMRAKLLGMAVGMLPGVGIFLAVFPHAAVLHYTFTSGMLGAAAILALCAEDRPDEGGMKGALLWIGCFNLRSQMGYLLMPFFLLTVLCNFLRYRKKGWLFSLPMILLFYLFTLTAESIGYHTESWKMFQKYNDVRSELYDYAVILPYEEAEELYDEAGISPEEVAIFRDYNVALLRVDPSQESMGGFNADDVEYMRARTELTEKVLQVARKAEALREKPGFGEELDMYLYELRYLGKPLDYQYPSSYAPYNLMAGVLYLLLLALFVTNPSFLTAFEGISLFLGRTLLWLYLYHGDRTPVRVMLPLYVGELVVLVAFVLQESAIVFAAGETKSGTPVRVSALTIESETVKAPRAAKLSAVLKRLDAFGSRLVAREEHLSDRGKKVRGFLQTGGILLFVIAALYYLPAQAGNLQKEYALRERTNESFAAALDQIRSDPGALYFADIYTVVSYTERCFEKGVPGNALLLGGWTEPGGLYAGRLGGRDAMTRILEGAPLIIDSEERLEHMTEYFASCGYEGVEWEEISPGIYRVREPLKG